MHFVILLLVLLLLEIDLDLWIILAYYLVLKYLFIIYLIFYHTDILTSFSIFFGFSHSLPMLLMEYEEMKEKSFLIFYLKTLPFTLLAISFGLVLYYFNNSILTTNNLILFVFIIISSLTLPHVFIMKDFVKSK